MDSFRGSSEFVRDPGRLRPRRVTPTLLRAEALAVVVEAGEEGVDHAVGDPGAAGAVGMGEVGFPFAALEPGADRALAAHPGEGVPEGAAVFLGGAALGFDQAG